MKNWLTTIWANKHTSGAAMFGFALGVTAILFPQYAGKCSQIQMLATAYGLAMAADGKQSSTSTPEPK